ncbi:MAG: MFS transporter [Anaerolineae bacterium]|nr:MFS transporter [Anaerolineae bacterium]
MQVTPQAAGLTKHHRKILMVTLCIAVFLYWTRLVAMLGSLIVSSAGHRITVKRLLTGGFLAMGIGLVGAASAPNMVAFSVAQLAIGLGYGICYPALMGASIQKVRPAEVTSAMGLHQSIYSIGIFAGPWLGGILANQMGIQLMFGLTAGILLVLSFLGIQLLGVRPTKAAGQGASA